MCNRCGGEVLYKFGITWCGRMRCMWYHFRFRFVPVLMVYGLKWMCGILVWDPVLKSQICGRKENRSHRKRNEMWIDWEKWYNAGRRWVLFLSTLSFLLRMRHIVTILERERVEGCVHSDTDPLQFGVNNPGVLYKDMMKRENSGWIMENGVGLCNIMRYFLSPTLFVSYERYDVSQIALKLYMMIRNGGGWNNNFIISTLSEMRFDDWWFSDK